MDAGMYCTVIINVCMVDCTVHYEDVLYPHIHTLQRNVLYKCVNGEMYLIHLWMWEMYGMNVWTSGCTVRYACMNVLTVLYECLNKWLYCTVCMYECVECTVWICGQVAVQYCTVCMYECVECTVWMCGQVAVLMYYSLSNNFLVRQSIDMFGKHTDYLQWRGYSQH